VSICKTLGGAACAAALMIAGRGGGSDTPTQSATQETPAPATQASTAPRATTPAIDAEADQAIADAAALKLADFPSGWTATPDDDDDKSPLDCPGAEALHGSATGKVTTPTFENDSNEQVFETLGVFADDTLPSQLIDAISNQEFLDCLRDNMVGAIEDAAESEDIELGDVQVVPLRVEDRGDESAGARVSIPMIIQGVSLNAALDLTAIRSGRGVLLLGTAGILSPMDDLDREHYAQLASDRLSEGLEQ